MKNNYYANPSASFAPGSYGGVPEASQAHGDAPAVGAAAPAGAAADFDVMRLLKRLYRHWFILLALWVTFAAVFFMKETRKSLVFSSTGVLNLSGAGNRPSLAAGMLGMEDNIDLTTQQLILRGRDLAVAVIQANGLNASVSAADPQVAEKISYRPKAKDWWLAERAGNAKIKRYQNGLSVSRSEVREDMDGWLSYTLKFRDAETFDVLGPNKMAVTEGRRLREMVHVDGAKFCIEASGDCRMAKDEEVTLNLGPPSAYVGGFQSSLWVRAQGGGPGQTSNLVEVGYSCDSPYVAQRVVGTVMDLYLKRSVEESKRSAVGSYDVVTRLLNTVTADLVAANKKLEDEQKSIRALDLDPVITKQMEAAAKASAQLEEAQRFLDRLLAVEKGFKTDDPPAADDVRLIELAAMGDAIVRASIDNYRSSQTRLRQLAQQLPEGHAELDKVRGEAAGAWLSVGRVVGAQVKEVGDQVKRLEKDVERSSKDFESLPETNRRMAELLRNVRIHQTNYDSLFAEKTRLSIARDTIVSNYAVLDNASLAGGPGAPLLNQAITSSMGLSFVLAALLVMLPGLRIRWFETAEEAMRVVVQPVFGVLPSTGQRSRRGERKILVQDPNGRWAEAMRLLRTNLMQAMAGKPSQVLMISGAQPGDGKSTVAANLAATLAQSLRVKSVLLIDADMHRPSLHGVFGVPQSPGLSDYLNGTATIEQVIHQVEIPGAEGKTLSFIPAGPIPPVPSDLVETEAMRELLAHARASHMFTVLDTPPYPLVSVAGVLAEYVDRVLTVCRIGRTTRGLYLRHVTQLARHGAHIGQVFNSPSAGRVGSAQDSYGYGDGYGYGYGYGYGAKEKKGAKEAKGKAETSANPEKKGS